jgi:hypothetical protein
LQVCKNEIVDRTSKVAHLGNEISVWPGASANVTTRSRPRFAAHLVKRQAIPQKAPANEFRL